MVLIHRVDDPRVRFLAEQHRAPESVALAEDLAQHRQRFLGAVLLVPGDQHDVLALAGTFLTFVRDPAGLRLLDHVLSIAKCQEREKGESEEREMHG